MKTLYILIFSFAFLSGCENIRFGKDKEVKKVEEVKSTVIYSEALTKVSVEAKNMSESDRNFSFKLFSGLNQYIINSEIQSSSELDNLIAKMQQDYKWGREKYPNFTSAVSDYLKEKNYQKAIKFDTKEARESTASIFFDLADAVKKAE